MDGKSLARARRQCLLALRRADRAGVEGLTLTDLFGYLSTRKAFRDFRAWSFREILGVLRDSRAPGPDLAEDVIGALEWLASDGLLVIGEGDGETVLLLTERGRDPGEK
jgi:hypothetical protein